MTHQPSRRNFLKTAAVASVGYWFFAGLTPKVSASPNERVAFAGIGAGARVQGDHPASGKGESDIRNAARFGDVVALCDVDKRRLAAVGAQYPRAKLYTDYRRLFDEQEKSIDAATISTPDHMHAPQALMAMRMKKHVFIQKPLARTLYESQLIVKVAKEMGVCTQMGNQGSANDNVRRDAVEMAAGVYGDIKEVHVWTDRPGTWWPHGPDTIKTMRAYEEKVRRENPTEAASRIAAMRERTAERIAGLDWDLWLGVAKNREFFPGEERDIYHIFGWRGWWDFGTGPMGDMACHLINQHMKALDLSSCESIVAWSSGHDFDAFPSASEIVFEYPDTPTRKGFKFVWYDGGRLPDREYLAAHGFSNFDNIRPSDSLIIGTDGIKGLGHDVRKADVVVPEVEFARRYPDPDGSIPERQNADIRHMFEFVSAIKENKPELCFSNAPDQSGPFSEAQALGNIALWTASKPNEWGEKILWDATSRQITNLASLQTPGIAELIKPVYPQGYTLD